LLFEYTLIFLFLKIYHGQPCKDIRATFFYININEESLWILLIFVVFDERRGKRFLYWRRSGSVLPILILDGWKMEAIKGRKIDDFLNKNFPLSLFWCVLMRTECLSVSTHKNTWEQLYKFSLNCISESVWRSI